MKQFLASVGSAKLLAKKNGITYHIADVRTLTEETLNFEVESEEIRAGSGAQLFAKFFHDSKLTVKISDAMWDMNYLSKILGNDDEFFHSSNGFYSERIERAGPTIRLSRTPQPIGDACILNQTLVWIKELGCQKTSEPKVVEVTNDSGIIIVPSELRGKAVCVEYFISMPQARSVKVLSNFIPNECILILTNKLFAGDPNKVSDGSLIGEVVIKIPRFALNGNLQISNTMTTAATMEIEGLALRTNACCSDVGTYAEITQIEYTSSKSGFVEIVVNPESVVIGGIPEVWGIYRSGPPVQIPFEDCVFEPAIDEDEGIVAGVLYTVTVDGLTDTFIAYEDFNGNPLTIMSRAANNTTSIVITDDNKPEDEFSFDVSKNIKFISGDTNVYVNSSNSSEHEEVVSTDQIFWTAGDYNVVIS